jgi:hypothetical protein
LATKWNAAEKPLELPFCCAGNGSVRLTEAQQFKLVVGFRDASMRSDIADFNRRQDARHQALCDALATTIDNGLPDAEAKIWHGHPVWFLQGNPIVGYSKQKPGIRLMFWSGADFAEPALDVIGQKFKDASVFLDTVDDLDMDAMARWLTKAQAIQWDYANIVKRRGELKRLP